MVESIEKAKEKLENELSKAKGNGYAEPIIAHLLERIKDSESLAEDVLQEHKTWTKCFEFIKNQAKRMQKNGCAVVRDDVVFEWAEDYYHKDDKAEEEEKAKKEAEKKKKEAEKKKKEASAPENKTRKKESNKSADKARADYNTAPKASTDNHKLSNEEIKKVKEKKVLESGNAIPGQMSIFSFLG